MRMKDCKEIGSWRTSGRVFLSLNLERALVRSRQEKREKLFPSSHFVASPRHPRRALTGHKTSFFLQESFSSVFTVMDDAMDLTSTDDDLDITKVVRKDIGRDEYVRSEVISRFKARAEGKS